jgi:hypothetical protein
MAVPNLAVVSSKPQVSNPLAKKFTDPIDALGFGWTIDTNFNLKRVDPSRRVQVRDEDNYAPKANVKAFQIQMESSVFPPIVVTSDDWIVDGNTRVAARIARKDGFCEAIVIDRAFGSGTAKVKGEIMSLAAQFNQSNGQRLTNKEVRSTTLELIRAGFTSDMIAQIIGVKGSAVGNLKREEAAFQRMTKLKIDSSNFDSGFLRAFGQESVVRMNDAPFKDLVDLAHVANFKSAEIKSVADEVIAAGSDQAAAQLLAEQRLNSAQRIRDHRMYGNGKPAPASRLRQTLGYVNGFDGDPGKLVEQDPSAVDKHVEVLKQSITVLQAVLDLQGA